MVPSISFRGQPFNDEDTAGSFLRQVLEDSGVESLTIVVAWARFGGLRRLAPEITAFRERGGQLRIVLGIDEGGATVPGLKLAIRLADQPFVFHDRTARTFHPKLYLAEGPDKAILLAGSSNLTAGGLLSNYEASLEVEFELPEEIDAKALVGAREYIEMLLADEQLCLPLDEELLDRLIQDPRYVIAQSERRRQTAASEVSPDGFAQTGEASEGVFGVSQHDKPPVQGMPQRAREELRELEETVEFSWTKRLPATDAQQPPSPKSNPVGNLRLTKAGNPIDWRTWFREDMFGAASWFPGEDSKGNPIETATVQFLVTITGQSHGTVGLRVDHAPHRESGQHNHATVLHWGPLMPVLRATDYTGHTVTLRRMSDGAYRLDISP